MKYEFEHDEITMCRECPCSNYHSEDEFMWCGIKKSAYRTWYGVKKMKWVENDFFKDCPLKKVEAKHE